MKTRDPRIDPRGNDILGDKLGLLHVIGFHNKKGEEPYVRWERQAKGSLRSNVVPMKTSLEKWKIKVKDAVVVLRYCRKG